MTNVREAQMNHKSKISAADNAATLRKNARDASSTNRAYRWYDHSSNLAAASSTRSVDVEQYGRYISIAYPIRRSNGNDSRGRYVINNAFATG